VLISPSRGLSTSPGDDAERDTADAAAVRRVGGRTALRRDGRLLGRPPLMLVAIRIFFIHIVGQSSVWICTISVTILAAGFSEVDELFCYTGVHY
jgi:hypothetical protein